MNKPFENHTWLGMMSLPRVVEVKNGQIITNVHPNISSLFTKEVDIDHVDLKNSICIKATLTGDRAKVCNQENVALKSSTKVLEDNCYIEVYIDYGVVEVYINNGQYVMSHIVNPLESKLEASNLSDFKVYTIN